MEYRFITCEHCGGEGRIYVGHPNDPHPRDAGSCPECKGECVVEIGVEPAVCKHGHVNCSDCDQF